MPACRRGGFTLLELLLAITIMVTALAALFQLTASGLRMAQLSQHRTEAAIRCETKLREILAGAEQARPVVHRRFEDSAEWYWSVEISEAETPGLLLLNVSVFSDPRAQTHLPRVSLKCLVSSNRLAALESASFGGTGS